MTKTYTYYEMRKKVVEGRKKLRNELEQELLKQLREHPDFPVMKIKRTLDNPDGMENLAWEKGCRQAIQQLRCWKMELKNEE